MLNQYETVFIATPVLSENQMKEAVQKFKKIITDSEGEIIHEENWGLKKLAYPIQKKSTGFYYLIEFRGRASWLTNWKYSTGGMRESSVSLPSVWTSML
jgi:small subunit ribosomal protein S6